MKKLTWLLAGLLLFGPALQTANAHPQNDKQTSTIDQIKIQVAKLGVGDKARATITTKDGAKIKGYVYRAGDDDFVMRDGKTGNPATIRYADVAKVEADHGPSAGRNVLSGVAIGTGAAVTAILFAFFVAAARHR